MLLQQDNARPHVARLVTQHLANVNIQHLKWRFVSRDLSPIEHMWDELECRLRQMDNQPQSMLELSDALIEEWDNIPETAGTDNLNAQKVPGSHLKLRGSYSLDHDILKSTIKIVSITK